MDFYVIKIVPEWRIHSEIILKSRSWVHGFLCDLELGELSYLEIEIGNRLILQEEHRFQKLMEREERMRAEVDAAQTGDAGVESGGGKSNGTPDRAKSVSLSCERRKEILRESKVLL